MNGYLTIDNINFEGKIVCVRVDLNSPIIEGKVFNSPRIIKVAHFLKELIEKNAKIVLISHQGRIHRNNCFSLKEHKELLEKELKQEIDFSKELYSSTVEKKIKKLKNGKILMLENLRKFDEEINFENIEVSDNKIQKVADLCNYYIQDSFSVMHRNHYSITQVRDIEIVCGRNLEDELKHLQKIDIIKDPHIYILGGSKPKDIITLIEDSLNKKKVDKILLCGIIGEIGLIAKNIKLGIKEEIIIKKYFNEIEKMKEILTKYDKKIILPIDLVLNNTKENIIVPVSQIDSFSQQLSKYETGDIGPQTINEFEKHINRAKSIYLKGSCGRFEKIEFEAGTKQIFSIVSKSKAYSFIGGGDTTSAAKMFNLIDKFSYVSLAGGALLKYIETKKLIGLQTIKNSFDKYYKEQSDFVIVGTNTIDIKVDVPMKVNQVELGTKLKIKDNFKFGVGGGGMNISLCLSKFDTKVSYLGKLSKEFKEYLLDSAQRNKINIIKSNESKKGVSKSILLQSKDKDRVIFHYPGQNEYLDYSDFDIKDLKTNNFIFSPMSNKSFKTQLKIAQRIKKLNHNSKITYLYGSRVSKEKKLSTLLKLTNLIICNFDEAKEFTEKRDIDSCLKSLQEFNEKNVIITDGSQGAYFYNGQTIYFQKAIPPKKIIDTTGAGDCFSATFIYFFSKKYSIKDSLLFASKNASNFITKNGTQNGLLTMNELVLNQKKF